MKKVEDKFCLEVGDSVYSTITNKILKVVEIHYFGTQIQRGTAYFDNSAGCAYCCSDSMYFKSAYHSCIEIDESKGKGYFFIKQ